MLLNMFFMLSLLTATWATSSPDRINNQEDKDLIFYEIRVAVRMWQAKHFDSVCFGVLLDSSDLSDGSSLFSPFFDGFFNSCTVCLKGTGIISVWCNHDIAKFP